ncbi:MAG: M13 family metallopeptidase [bacterium]|nr:M13 family metallopeptidase [bacterium]
MLRNYMFKTNKSRLMLLTIFLAVFLTVSCSSDKTTEKPEGKTADKVTVQTAQKPSGEYKGFDLSDMDAGVKPGENFYLYVNGNWIKNNPIPAEFSRWSTMDILRDKCTNDVKVLLEEMSSDKSAAEGSNPRKISDFYAAAMDEAKIEAEGTRPLEGIFKRIAEAKDKKQFQEVLARLHMMMYNGLFSISPRQDPGNTEIVLVFMSQGGLGLPDRDYYIDEKPRAKKLREEYVKHMTRMFELLKETPEQAAKFTETVMAVETRLAKASMTRLQRRDPKATYNKKSLPELDQMTPHFDFAAYFKNVGLGDPGHVNVGQPKFFEAVSTLVNDTPLDDLKTYLRWNVIRRAASLLGSEFVAEDYRFRRGVLRGTKKIQPRWKRVQNTINMALGEAVGEAYVAKYFPPEAKKRAYKLVMTLKEVMAERINKLEWMGAETKERALAKLAAVKIKIGYPDKWIDYSGLKVTRDSFAGNIMAALKFHFKRRMSRVGKSPDRTQWGMTPQTVNAYFHPLLNEIVFPAAILQSPFFDFKADDALNYGGIGVVIGHELSHGFDDRGRQYDKDGRLNDWWTPEDEKRFKERADRLVEQYNAYVAVDDVHVNGRLTLGENIADLGGLQVAYDSLLKAMAGSEAKKIDGFTPQQRFFLSWARLWRTNIRKASLLLSVKTNPHAPGRFRAIGPLANTPAFYEAFDLKPGDALYKEEKDRIKIW